jgi:beta-glucanase (GH16 family)
VDFSVPGQVTVWARASAGFGHEADGGIMVPPTGARAGFGHGRYEFTLSFEEDLATGGYALLWPATDVWPGPELDVVELNLQGQPYSALHWADENGDNQYAPHPLRGFDPAGVHTYAMERMPDHISVFVDGVLQYRETSPEVLAKDFARGGQNAAPGIGMQTFWAQQVQDGDNAITLYDFKYLAPDGIA